MELSLTVLSQVFIMFLLIGLGFLAAKLKFVNKDGNKQLTNILLYFVSPLVIINAYQIPFSSELFSNLIIALILGVVSHIIAIAVAYAFIRKKGNEARAPIERFAIIYSNCGFMALPLVSALFGSEGVFYASAYMMVFQVLSWTHGYIMMSKKSDLKTIRSAFLSPVVISVAVGILIFLLQINLPSVVSSVVSSMAALNTPVAMLVTGVTLAGSNMLDAFKQKRCYYIVALSCVVVPVLAMALYLCFPFLPADIVVVNLIATACPCAVLTILFANKFGLDEPYAAKVLTLCNLLCIITIPLIVFLYQSLSSALH